MYIEEREYGSGVRERAQQQHRMPLCWWRVQRAYPLCLLLVSRTVDPAIELPYGNQWSLLSTLAPAAPFRIAIYNLVLCCCWYTPYSL